VMDDTPIQEGDSLVLSGTPDTLNEVINRLSKG
jgi:hypothetical protein